MFKKILFQLHWLLGISAGLVLALVGITGGMMSFEDEILLLANPHVMRVDVPVQARLSMPELLKRVALAEPEKHIASITVDNNPAKAWRVGFALAPDSKIKKGLDWQYVNPYDATLLGKASGAEFFLFVMKLHRWLALDDVGKQVVGASTIALVFLCISGLYLRWPRQVFNWRTWLTFSMKRTGRSFLWDLHSVVSTWALVFYLLASLTGLYWSYDWYRGFLFDMAGVTRPVKKEGRRENTEKKSAIPDINNDAVWQGFLAQAGNYQTATIRFPEKDKQAVQISYLPDDAAHDRATNKLELDPQTGTLNKQDLYQNRSTGEQLMNSIFALHSGSYFGLTGLILMMIASLIMPLFTITGWMLYLDRRAKKRELQQAKQQQLTQPAQADTSIPNMLIAFASQTGFAEQLAWRTAQLLQTAGLAVTVQPLSSINHAHLGRYEQALFVVSTFGEGEPPDSARGFAKLMQQAHSLSNLRFGLLALGDKQYRHFCSFGRQIEQWLHQQGATSLFDRIEVDQQDPSALGSWQQQLRQIAGISDSPAWHETPFSQWRLQQRTCLNLGSQGLPTYHLELRSDANLHWQAGDILEVAIPNTKVTRQYSIASLPADGSLHLLVRQAQYQGTSGLQTGLGSGWLTQQLPLNGIVNARIKSNSGFQLPATAAPLILIGNGTGLAGLRSHLKARIAQGQQRNWLIFGERNRLHDAYYHDELDAWQQANWLAQLDLVFSRDQAQRIYVQQRLQLRAAQLRDWINDGAVIMICGSLSGMAPEVDAMLRTILGDTEVDELITQRRYLRDVY